MTPVLRGATLMVVAATSIAVDTIIIRTVVAEVHPFEIAFFRNFFSLIILAPWLLRTGVRGLDSPRMMLHVSRALLKLGAIICFFYAVKLLPLVAVTAVIFTAPLFIALGSMAFLGEPAHRRRLIALIVGFAGVLIVVRPGSDVFDAYIVFALAAAVGLGGVGILMKYLSVRENPPAIVSLNLFITMPFALLLMLPVWTLPSPSMLGLLVIQGCLGGVAQLCFSRALSLADASVMIPMDFIRLPLVALLAWLIVGEASDVWTLVGGVVIFAATIGLIGRERRVVGPGLPS